MWRDEKLRPTWRQYVIDHEVTAGLLVVRFFVGTHKVDHREVFKLEEVKLFEFGEIDESAAHR